MYKTIHLLLERRIEWFCYRHYTFTQYVCIAQMMLFNYNYVFRGNDRSPNFFRSLG